MSFEKFLFYVFAAILVIAALRVITARNPIHAAMYLVLSFCTSAGLWVLLEAEFLAMTLVLVYVGAVMVLFLFVVMMLDINVTPLREGFIRYAPVGGVVALLIFVEIVGLVAGDYFRSADYTLPPPHAADYSNTRELGRVLYTEYAYPFEIAAVILLVAIVAAIVLTLRRRPGTRYLNPAAQVKVRREDRIRLVKTPPEKLPVAAARLRVTGGTGVRHE